jgi:hypothetical protein
MNTNQEFDSSHEHTGTEVPTVKTPREDSPRDILKKDFQTYCGRKKYNRTELGQLLGRLSVLKIGLEKFGLKKDQVNLIKQHKELLQREN